MRAGSQPVVVGLAENPWPGSEGITRWKASAALAPCAVGSVSGSMIFSCSMIEPGHPCVTISGSASSCWERTWMKWMSSPSISVMKFGSAFSFASHLAPVVVGRPVARELLHRRERHALRVVGDRLALGPPGRVDAPAQIGELLLGEADLERADSGAVTASLQRQWRTSAPPGLGVVLGTADGRSSAARPIAPVNPLVIAAERQGIYGRKRSPGSATVTGDDDRRRWCDGVQ